MHVHELGATQKCSKQELDKFAVVGPYVLQNTQIWYCFTLFCVRIVLQEILVCINWRLWFAKLPFKIAQAPQTRQKPSCSVKEESQKQFKFEFGELGRTKYACPACIEVFHYIICTVTDHARAQSRAVKGKLSRELALAMVQYNYLFILC